VLWTGAPRHGGDRPQRRVLRRQGDRPLALRHRHLRPHGPSRSHGAPEGRRRVRPRVDHRLEVHRPDRGRAKVGDRDAIVPSIEGWARVTGINTIFVDDRDPYWQGFQVADR
jgi:4-hydroxyproline epimerase